MNMKRSFFLIALLMILAFEVLNAQADQERPALYDPGLDARMGLEEAVNMAKNKGKHVLVMVGGNW
jgi:hypothetical protein